MPEAGLSYGLRRRVSGRPGPTARRGVGRLARESPAKPKRLIASASLGAGQKPIGTLLYQLMLELLRALPRSVRQDGRLLVCSAAVALLFPLDC